MLGEKHLSQVTPAPFDENRSLNHHHTFLEQSRLAKTSKASRAEPSWGDIRKKIETFDRKGLVALVHDLYGASTANRRFLHARLLPSPSSLDRFRRLVANAIYPDPFSRRQISLRDASAAITEYRRSTGDDAGTVDLMLTFIEAGTEQAADLGYGDETYFSALENKIAAILKYWPRLLPTTQAQTASRLASVGERAKVIGWGYGDYVDDVVAGLQAALARKGARKSGHAV